MHRTLSDRSLRLIILKAIWSEGERNEMAVGRSSEDNGMKLSLVERGASRWYLRGSGRKSLRASQGAERGRFEGGRSKEDVRKDPDRRPRLAQCSRLNAGGGGLTLSEKRALSYGFGWHVAFLDPDLVPEVREFRKILEKLPELEDSSQRTDWYQ